MGKLQLEGKTALVCGGSDGLGYRAAVELAMAGAKIVIVGRSSAKLDEKKSALDTINGLDNKALQLDFIDVEILGKSIDDLVDIMPIHILINNCGGPPPGNLLDADLDSLQLAFGKHVLASHLISKKLIPNMISAGYGRIVNIISTSVRQPIMGLGVSNTIRGAMASWSKTLSLELAETGITVNNVLPGTTKTGRLDGILKAKQSKFKISMEEAEKMMLSQIPMNRFAEVAEISRSILFLASPDASYITGVSLQVDGGKIKSI